MGQVQVLALPAKYSAFGATLQSALPLPELDTWGRADPFPGPEITIRFEPLDSLRAGLSAQPEHVLVGPAEVRMLWEDIGIFVSRGGREILVHPAPGADERLVRAAVLGPVMAAVLYQAGYLVLHASAVRIGAGIAAFLGRSGWGKSTIAGAFTARGCPPFADDLLAIRVTKGAVEAFPGVPILKLLPDALNALGNDPAGLPHVEPDSEKRGLAPRGDNASSVPRPLARLYVLNEADRLSLEPLSAKESFFELTVHSYGADWLCDAAAADQFRARAELARIIQVRRLSRPLDLGLLPAVVAAVEGDVA